MAKMKYKGEDTRDVAGIGIVNPGAIVGVTTEQAAAMEKHSPETWELVPDETKVAAGTPPKVKKAAESAG